MLTILQPSAVMDQDQSRTLTVHKDWSKKDFDRACKALDRMDIKLEAGPETLEAIKKLLNEKRQYLMLMLGNPNLIEHESFSNMLWATLHLADELSRRSDLNALPRSDISHLRNDAKRAYVRLLAEWFSHLCHLKAEYPYLFSYEMRTNPFDPDSSVVITQ